MSECNHLQMLCSKICLLSISVFAGMYMQSHSVCTDYAAPYYAQWCFTSLQPSMSSVEMVSSCLNDMAVSNG